MSTSLGSVVWSGTATGSISVPVTPSQNSVTMLTIPAGLPTDVGNVLLVAMGVMDPLHTVQGAQLDVPPSITVMVVPDATGLPSRALSGGGSLSILVPPAFTDQAFGAGRFENFIESNNQTPEFILPSGSFAGGATVRLITSARLVAVTGLWAVAAALFSGPGPVPIITGTGTGFLTFLSPTSGSGSINTNASPAGRTNFMFAMGNGTVDNLAGTFTGTATPPNYAVDPNWTGLAVSNGRAVAGLAWINSVGPGVTNSYSYTQTFQGYSAGGIFFYRSTISSGRGFAQVVG